MKVIPFTQDQAARWDEFVLKTAQGVFLHTRGFLSYHRDRFQDRSLLFEDGKGRLRALLPAALSLDDPVFVISHPGITFGGFLHDPGCCPDEVQAYIDATLDHFKAEGRKGFLYRAAPAHALHVPVALDQHALWRRGAQLVRRDLWNVLKIDQERQAKSGHKSSVNRAHKNGVVSCVGSHADYKRFHGILAENLEKRYAVSPVHSLAEMVDVQRLFPKNVELWVARDAQGNLLAGVWLFRYSDCTWHTQYIASTEAGRESFATHHLLEAILQVAKKDAVTFFSFGASTESVGQVVNSGLFEFKAGFGHGSTVQDFYEIEL